MAPIQSPAVAALKNSSVAGTVSIPTRSATRRTCFSLAATNRFSAGGSPPSAPGGVAGAAAGTATAASAAPPTDGRNAPVQSKTHPRPTPRIQSVALAFNARSRFILSPLFLSWARSPVYGIDTGPDDFVSEGKNPPGKKTLPRPRRMAHDPGVWTQSRRPPVTRRPPWMTAAAKPARGAKGGLAGDGRPNHGPSLSHPVPV